VRFVYFFINQKDALILKYIYC